MPSASPRVSGQSRFYIASLASSPPSMLKLLGCSSFAYHRCVIHVAALRMLNHPSLRSAAPSAPERSCHRPSRPRQQARASSPQSYALLRLERFIPFCRLRSRGLIAMQLDGMRSFVSLRSGAYALRRSAPSSFQSLRSGAQALRRSAPPLPPLQNVPAVGRRGLGSRLAPRRPKATLCYASNASYRSVDCVLAAFSRYN